MVDAIARTMQETGDEKPALRRARWPARVGVAFAAVAAVAILTVGTGLWRARRVNEPVAAHLYTVFGASHALVGGRELVSSPQASGGLPLAFRSQVATEPASFSRLKLVSGVEVTVGSETSVILPEASGPSTTREELVLERGSIHVEVPKLPSGHFFAIRTPAALVSVHGTSFSVDVTKAAPASLPRTHVAVTAGVVSVLFAGQETFLQAGMDWTSVDGLAPAAPVSPMQADSRAAPSAPTQPRTTRHDRDIQRTASAPAAAEAPRDPASTQTELASENRLFSDAMSARDHDDQPGALRLLNELIGRYPMSPLAEDAHVERFRALARLGQRRAVVRAARAYLALYPNGFAREEARALALDSSTQP